MDFPRLLVIDQTLIGDGTATGQIKHSLFKTWPQDRFAQIYCSKFLNIGVHGLEAVPGFDPSNLSLEDAVIIARGFAPQAILYRPTPNQPILHEAALAIIDQLSVPLVIWIMDDWLSPLERTQPKTFLELDRDVRRLLKQAHLRLSICDEMSAAFEERYGVPFKAFANAIDPDDWPVKYSSESRPGPLRLRYAGSLAHDMTLDSVLRVAQAVEELAAEKVPVTLEIKTRPYWRLITQKHFKRFKNTITITDNLSEHDYRRWLCEADIILIAYNFDEASLEYVKYSRANKLPECLACGAALLVHGPTGLPTTNFVAKHNCGAIASADDFSELKGILSGLIRSDDQRRALVERARAVAVEECNVHRIREALRSEIAATAAAQPSVSETTQALTSAHPRIAQAHVEEAEVISLLCAEESAAEQTIIHVGAAIGQNANDVGEKAWTIRCFKADPVDRGQLKRTFRKNVSLRPLADIVKDGDLTRIDLLAINDGAMSFDVLKDVPWDTVRPSVIKCEYDEAKSIEIGFTYRRDADYLVARGYSVYISEWHPIIRPGWARNWYRLKRYPCELAQPNAWCNLLAFRVDPGDKRLSEAYEVCLKTRQPPAAHLQRSLTKTLIGSILAPRITKLRHSTGHWLRLNLPRFYALAARAERKVWQLTRFSLVLAAASFSFPSIMNELASATETTVSFLGC